MAPGLCLRKESPDNGYHRACKVTTAELPQSCRWRAAASGRSLPAAHLEAMVAQRRTPDAEAVNVGAP